MGEGGDEAEEARRRTWGYVRAKFKRAIVEDVLEIRGSIRARVQPNDTRAPARLFCQERFGPRSSKVTMLIRSECEKGTG